RRSARPRPARAGCSSATSPSTSRSTSRSSTPTPTPADPARPDRPTDRPEPPPPTAHLPPRAHFPPTARFPPRAQYPARPACPPSPRRRSACDGPRASTAPRCQNRHVLFARIAEVSAAVAATRSRLEKRALLAAALREAEPEEAEVVATYLSGRVRQRRTGVGWRTLADLPDPAPEPSLSPVDVDRRLEEIAVLTGAGSQTGRARAVAELFAALTTGEQQFLRGLILGEVRQGAL